MSNTDEVVSGLEASGKGRKSAGARGKAPDAAKRPVKSTNAKVDTMPSGIKRTNW